MARQLLLLSGAALALAAALGIALSPAREVLADAVGWFARRESFQSVVSESSPLLTGQRSAYGVLTWRY